MSRNNDSVKNALQNQMQKSVSVYMIITEYKLCAYEMSRVFPVCVNLNMCFALPSVQKNLFKGITNNIKLLCSVLYLIC